MSPFTPVEGNEPLKAWTLSIADLTRSLPAHLISTAAPPQERVTLSLPASVEKADHLDVTLSQIYRSCPHLFAQPITPAMDSRIQLPFPAEQPQTVPAGNSPFSEAGSSPGSSPFTMSDPPPAKAAPETGFFDGREPEGAFDSPFSAAEKSDGDSMPFGGSPFSAAPETGQESPFQTAPSSGAKVNPFQPVSSAPSGDGPPPAASRVKPAGGNEGPLNLDDLMVSDRDTMSGTPKDDSDDSHLTFDLQSLVDGAVMMGAGKQVRIPFGSQARIPLQRIRAQLPRGRVSIAVAELRDYVDRNVQEALQGLDESAEVPIPLKDIFHQLPADMLPEPEGSPSASTGFETPFSPELDQSKAGGSFDDLPIAPRTQPESEPPAQPPAATASPFLAKNSVAEPQAAAVAREEKPPEAQAAPSSGSSPFPSIVPGPSSSSMPKQQEEARPAVSEPRKDAGPAPSSTPPSWNAETAVSREEARPAPSSGAVGAGTLQGLQLDQPIEDLELKAIFGVSDSFDLRRVVEMASSLPGVEGAMILNKEGRTLAECGPRLGSREADLLSRASSIYGHMRCLVEEIGFGAAETFSLQTNRGIIHFFGEEDRILIVVQNHPGFEPGVREKLTMASRGAAHLKA